MLFPDGKFLSPRWRRLSLAMITLIFLLTLVTLFWPGQLLKIVPNPAPDLQNPFALSLETARPWEVIVFPVKDIVMMIFPLLGFISIFFRWRHAEGDVRQQIKWIVLFLMTAGMVFFSVELIGTTVYPSIFDSWWYPFETIIFLLGFPIVFGLAVFKYRLYDIDIIIRRTLVYSLVTLALVLVYFGSVILLQRLFTGVSGQQSPLAIVLSTLLIAALFNPLRHSVQDVIDRRFYRKKYDAQQVLAQFAQTARDETDMAVLVAELVQVAQEMMQPEGLGIWLKNDRS